MLPFLQSFIITAVSSSEYKPQSITTSLTTTDNRYVHQVRPLKVQIAQSETLRSEYTGKSQSLICFDALI